MLKNTFIHIKGIGRETEKRLWKKGIYTWNDYKKIYQPLFNLFNKNFQNDIISESIKALNAGVINFFVERLENHDYYRIALAYPNDVMFLDIETTGLSLYYHKITIIGWLKNNKYKVYVNGQNATDFFNDMQSTKVLITFNGVLFDCKFIKKEFPKIIFPKCHIDLRYLARRFNLKGGQKSIEKQINFKRSKTLENLSGENAPMLWYEFLHGNTESFKKLIQYNCNDIDGMRRIFDECVKLSCIKYEIPQKISNSLPKFSDKYFFVDDILYNDNYISDIYRTKHTQNIKLSLLHNFVNVKRICIAGIDLASSKEKKSGFCLLKDGHVQTYKCGNDEEIIQLILESNVNLVSIDAPLSIPFGRDSCWDTDPKREKFGITRYCERELHRRGISSYPCLIQSMQKLTNRGINLAFKLRIKGIPVIESYPGAAQDILGIPKKQNSIEYLSKGLQEFGIIGEFINKNVTHDELDAITSAIVGEFFWVGKFEALGMHSENYLIIPNINIDNNNWINRKVIGVSCANEKFMPQIINFFVKRGYKFFIKNCEENIYTIPHQKMVCCVSSPEEQACFLEIFGPAFMHMHINCANKPLISTTNNCVQETVKTVSSLANITVDIDDFTSNLDKIQTCMG